MKKKVVIQFTLLTFLIAVVTWGIYAIFGIFGLTVENALWLYIFIALCAFSPTIASYIVLKKNHEVAGFREWLKNVFAVKSPFRFYLLTIILTAVYLIPQIAIVGLKDAQPFFMFFVLLPATLLFGGIEEAGWRYVLQPELDKKFGLILSSLMVAAIWTVWHIPVFLPQGRIESPAWFGLFAIDILGLTFALGAISRITKSVFLCVFFHTITNAGAAVFYGYSDSLIGTILSAGLLIAVSMILVYAHENKNKQAG